jgi:hypothetical protein
MSRKSKHNRTGIAALLDAEEDRKRSTASEAPSNADAWPTLCRPVMQPLQTIALPHVMRPSIDIAAACVPAEHYKAGPLAYYKAGPLAARR